MDDKVFLDMNLFFLDNRSNMQMRIIVRNMIRKKKVKSVNKKKERVGQEK